MKRSASVHEPYYGAIRGEWQGLVLRLTVEHLLWIWAATAAAVGSTLVLVMVSQEPLRELLQNQHKHALRLEDELIRFQSDQCLQTDWFLEAYKVLF